MTSTDTRAAAMPAGRAADDYRRVCDAIRYLTDNWRDQPGLAEVAQEIGLNEFHFQKLFKRWAGISPKEFVQALTLDHARAMLRDHASVLDTAYEVGLSGPSRLHDLFVTYEGLTPGEFKSGGEGLEVAHAFHASPFGEALVMATARGLVGLAFADGPHERAAVLADMIRRWPGARYTDDAAATGPYAARIFDPARWRADQPLRVVMIGTDFEVRVWQTLLRIPMGIATTYGDIASHIGRPKAARAVGAAVGKNPISFVVPCHRVLGRSGSLTGYHWGLTRKRAIIGWEAALSAQAAAA